MDNRNLKHYLGLSVICLAMPALTNCTGNAISATGNSNLKTDASNFTFSLVYGDPDDPNYNWSDDVEVGTEPVPFPSLDPNAPADPSMYCSEHQVNDIVFNFENLGSAGNRNSSSITSGSGQKSLNDLIAIGLELTASSDLNVNTLFAYLGADGNFVILDDGLEAGLRVPSSHSSGLKIKIHPAAHLSKGKTYIFKMKLKQSAKIKWHDQKQLCQLTPPILEVSEVIKKN